MQRRWAPPHQPADKRCIAMQGEAMDDFYAARKAELQGELADLYRAAQQAGARGPRDLGPWLEPLTKLLRQLQAIEGKPSPQERIEPDR